MIDEFTPGLPQSIGTYACPYGILSKVYDVFFMIQSECVSTEREYNEHKSRITMGPSNVHLPDCLRRK